MAKAESVAVTRRERQDGLAAWAVGARRALVLLAASASCSGASVVAPSLGKAEAYLWDSTLSVEVQEGDTPMCFLRPAQGQCDLYRARLVVGINDQSSNATKDAGANGTINLLDRCCCPPEQRCLRRGVCSQCQGAFVRWRSEHDWVADAAVLALLSSPRFTLLAISAIGSDDILGSLPEQNPAPLVWLIRMLSDSFWWVLPLVHALVASCFFELRTAWHLFFAHQQRSRLEHVSDVVEANLRSVCDALQRVLFVLLLNRVAGSEARVFVVTFLLTLSAVRSVFQPDLLMNRGRGSDAFLHAALSVVTLLGSHRFLFDATTWTIFTLVVVIIGHHFRNHCVRVVRHGSVVLIDRSCFFESSIKALCRLGRANLTAAPYICYTSPCGREEGVDLGGLVRDWLSRLADEFLDPARGFVAIVDVRGVPYARLRPGGDLEQFEAMGKMLGLIIRSRLSLGISLCPPLLHLLVHPELPLALERISKLTQSEIAMVRHTTAVDNHRCHRAWLQLRAHFLRIEQFASSLLCSQSGSEAQGERMQGRRELGLLDFSHDWLQWVSQDEHLFWKRALAGSEPESVRDELVRGVCAELPNGDPVTLCNVREHMNHRALRCLVLDVAEETKAVWRGLRSVPGVPLPQLAEETMTSRRRKRALDAEEWTDSPHHCTSPVLPTGKQGARKRRRLMPPTQRSLQVLLNGSVNITVEAWKTWTDVSPQGIDGTPEGAQTLRWYWAYIESLDMVSRSALLHWITGYRQLPAPASAGFPPPTLRMTVALFDDDSESRCSCRRLPVAHTCSLRLDLPMGYSCEDELRSKFEIASANTQFFLA